MNKSTLFLVAAILSALGSIAQYLPAQPIALDPNVRMGKLSNGLTYYIRKNAKPANKVELRLAVNAGSIQEDADQRGLAHFMEHMNFNGSKHFPKNELVDYLQKVGVQFGADLNAYTSFDETVYMLPISSDDSVILEKGFTVLEDWAFNNLLDKEEIERERGVVLEESRLSKGAQERMLRVYFPKLFNGSKYADRLPIGSDSILKKFTPATLERYYRQWYRPELMAVVVVGDIDPALAEKKIRAHFGSFKNPPMAPVRQAITPIRPRTRPEALVLTDPEATSTVLQVFNFIRPAKKVKTWGDYRQTLVDELLTSLINQRLEEVTQQENPPFVYGFTGLEGFIRGYEAFVSAAVIGDGTPKQALDALVAETERARRYGFLPSEFERAKARILNEAQQANNERDKSESGRIVQQYISHFLNGEPAPGAAARYAFLKQVLPTVKLSEINAQARMMPPNNQAFALLMAPESKKASLPSNLSLLGSMLIASKQAVKPYTEKVIASTLMDAGPTAGKIVKETSNAKLGTTDLTLSNGVTITLKPTPFRNDEILMDAWRWGGYHRFPLADKDNAKHAAQVVGEMGLKDMSPTDLKKFTAGKTIETTPYINEHEEGIEGSSSVKDLETFLQLVNLYFTAPRRDETLFKSYVSKQKSTLTYLKANPQAFFQDTLSKIIYGNHPWAEGLPDEAEFNNLDLDRLASIYQQIFGNADGMHFTFVGNLDSATVRPLLEKYLGSLPARPVPHQYKDNGIRQVKGVVQANVKKGKDAKSLVVFQWSDTASFNSRDNMALGILIQALNIKVTEKLREELGGMYSGGLNGRISKRPYEHYNVSGYIPCGPENVEKLSAALLDIIRNAQQNGVDEKDLAKVKETRKKQYAVSLQQNNAWLQFLSNAFIDQTDPENILNFEQRLESITMDDLRRAAKKFLPLDNYVRAVLYPENATVPEEKKGF